MSACRKALSLQTAHPERVLSSALSGLNPHVIYQVYALTRTVSPFNHGKTIHLLSFDVLQYKLTYTHKRAQALYHDLGQNKGHHQNALLQFCSSVHIPSTLEYYPSESHSAASDSDSIDHSPPGSCPWDFPGENTGVVPFSRGSSRPRNRTGVFCIAGGFFTVQPPGKLLEYYRWIKLFLDNGR